ncbi:MAG: hypothetical protein GX088_03810 [Clostridia bacterium]|nr:hypothetical protein [Clostridia bacterium]
MAVTAEGTVADSDKEHKVRFYGVIQGLSANDIEFAPIPGGKPEVVTDETERGYAGAGDEDLVLAWGPEGGFQLNEHDYSKGVTTVFKAKIKKAGTYTVRFVFYDLTANKQINGADEKAKITVNQPHSTYKFSYEVPEEIKAGEEYEVPVTIEPETVGDLGYNRVRFDVTVTTPEGANLQLLAKDTNGVMHDVAQIGYWGPKEGFPIDAEYSATTVFKASFSGPGKYSITFSLVDLDTEEALITETVEITVETG